MPAIRYTRDQTSTLEKHYSSNKYITPYHRQTLAEKTGFIDKGPREALAHELQITSKFVQQWYQRQRNKTGKTRRTAKRPTARRQTDPTGTSGFFTGCIVGGLQKRLLEEFEKNCFIDKGPREALAQRYARIWLPSSGSLICVHPDCKM